MKVMTEKTYQNEKQRFIECAGVADRVFPMHTKDQRARRRGGRGVLAALTLISLARVSRGLGLWFNPSSTADQRYLCSSSLLRRPQSTFEHGHVTRT